MSRMVTSRCLIAALAALLLSTPVCAQGRAAGAAPEPAGPAVPSPNRMRIMIRSAMMALTHAVLTGNYTVLRDLATPAFQQLNTTAQLSDSFRSLNETKLDLSPVLLIEPQLRQKPEIMPDGQLRLRGVFPTKPRQIDFDLAFQNLGGQWRLNGISVGASPAPADKTAERQPAPSAAQGQSAPAAVPAAKPVQAKLEAPPVDTPASKPRKPKTTTAGVVAAPVRPRDPEISAPTPAATKKRVAAPSRSSDPFSALSAPP